MSIKEQIIDQIKTKFTGVEPSILSRVAEKLSASVTSSDNVSTAVAGVTALLL
ncbi:MAG: hypothetical protein LIP02_02785 [Bacteroidales bacterium]|nr:hypothetical protein [Bacteroidales bacterium]